MLGPHVESQHHGNGKGEDHNIAEQIRECCDFVHDVDVRDAAAHLRWLGAPVVRDRIALEDCGEEDADPPAENVDCYDIDGRLESACGK